MALFKRAPKIDWDRLNGELADAEAAHVLAVDQEKRRLFEVVSAGGPAEPSGAVEKAAQRIEAARMAIEGARLVEAAQRDADAKEAQAKRDKEAKQHQAKLVAASEAVETAIAAMSTAWGDLVDAHGTCVADFPENPHLRASTRYGLFLRDLVETELARQSPPEASGLNHRLYLPGANLGQPMGQPPNRASWRSLSQLLREWTAGTWTP